MREVFMRINKRIFKVIFYEDMREMTNEDMNYVSYEDMRDLLMRI
jgi:hypothetical protein